MEKRILVDMSVTLLHHGHIRLLKQASELGRVIVGLTTDEEIKNKKGYAPELSYEERKEIIASIRYVDEIIPCPWLVDEAFLREHNIDLLVHGDDNLNHVAPEHIVILPRTGGVSSSNLRERVLDVIMALNAGKESGKTSDKLAHMLIQTIQKEFKLD